MLGDLACARVTVSSAGRPVDLGDTPRPPSEVDFQLVGDLASIARLLAAGPVRRRLGRLPVRHRLARIRGTATGSEHSRADRRAADLGRLGAAGVRLDPVLALTVAALMIEPDWTAGERFTIAHRERRRAVAGRLPARPRRSSPRWPPQSRLTARWRPSIVCSGRRAHRRARRATGASSRSPATSARSRCSGSGSIAHNPADKIAASGIVRAAAYARKAR